MFREAELVDPGKKKERKEKKRLRKEEEKVVANVLTVEIKLVTI